MDPKPYVYSGLSHDSGKLEIDSEILRKKTGYTKKDQKEIEKHPLYGYLMLKGNELTREIVVRTHLFQKDPYPKRLPKTKIPFSKETWKFIEKIARHISHFF